jgi:hypothetical protein
VFCEFFKFFNFFDFHFVFGYIKNFSFPVFSGGTDILECVTLTSANSVWFSSLSAGSRIRLRSGLRGEGVVAGAVSRSDSSLMAACTEGQIDIYKITAKLLRYVLYLYFFPKIPLSSKRFTKFLNFLVF